MNPPKILIIGAGSMGADLAFDFAAHGQRVLLKDIDSDALDRAKAQMKSLLRLMRLKKRAAFQSITLEGLFSEIDFVLDYEGSKDVSVVIENINEDPKMKRALYQELGSILSPEVLYCVNTSCLSITKVASFTPDPTRVIGTHFLNPVPLKNLVEVIRGYHTSEETLTETLALLELLDKEAVVVQDSPGFVTNRILMPMINEAIFTLHEGIATPSQVDRIFTQGFGHRMGPLATADLIGLDTILDSLLVLQDSFRDSKFRPCPLLLKMVDAGLLGRKTGEGFFSYAAF